MEEGGSTDGTVLPGYTLRVSARGRRVRLVMRRQGLEVVIPRGFDRGRVPELLAEKHSWIERAGREVEERRRRLDEQPPQLPDHIDLPAVGESWCVEYRAPSSGGGVEAANSRTGARARVRESGADRLVVIGDRTDFVGCREALCRWLSRRARRELVPRLTSLSRESGLGFSKVSVRQQRTRWGSCSRQGNISLNARLLLMPPEAVDYVLLHELCHTRRMDHSPAFWELLASHDHQYKAHRRLVRASAKSFPTWLDHEPQGSDM